jgi:hypothetical protein
MGTCMFMRTNFTMDIFMSFITLTCTDGQQSNKQYDHNDFQVDVPDSIGVSNIYPSMYICMCDLLHHKNNF